MVEELVDDGTHDDSVDGVEGPGEERRRLGNTNPTDTMPRHREHGEELQRTRDLNENQAAPPARAWDALSCDKYVRAGHPNPEHEMERLRADDPDRPPEDEMREAADTDLTRNGRS